MADTNETPAQECESLSREASPASARSSLDLAKDTIAADGTPTNENEPSHIQETLEMSETSTNKTRRIARVQANAERDTSRSKQSGNTESIQAKKPKQRRELDVMNRIRWDENFDTSDIIIGYEDRHIDSSIIEIPFDSWERESTADEFVPLHRIRYFRRAKDGEVLWHRALMIDKIFGSN